MNSPVTRPEYCRSFLRVCGGQRGEWIPSSIIPQRTWGIFRHDEWSNIWLQTAQFRSLTANIEMADGFIQEKDVLINSVLSSPRANKHFPHVHSLFQTCTFTQPAPPFPTHFTTANILTSGSLPICYIHWYKLQCCTYQWGLITKSPHMVPPSMFFGTIYWSVLIEV